MIPDQNWQAQLLSLSVYVELLPALNLENLDGDYFVPGTELEGAEGCWRELQAGKMFLC